MQEKAEHLKITCFSLNLLVPPLLCTHCYSVTLTLFNKEYQCNSYEHHDKCVVLITDFHIIIFSIFDCLDPFFFHIRSELQSIFRILKECKLNLQQGFSVLLFHGCWKSITIIFKHCLVLYHSICMFVNISALPWHLYLRLYQLAYYIITKVLVYYMLVISW